MIRVCHMTSVHHVDDTRVFHKECVSLAKAGYEVFLVAKGESFDRDGVHVIGVGPPPPGRVKRMTSFAKKVYRTALELDADIYHFHDPELLPWGLKLKKRGKHVIFDAHEQISVSISEKFWIPPALRSLIRFFYDRTERFVCRRLDAVLSVNPDMVDYYKELNSRAVMITNYPIFREGPAPSRQPATLVFVGGVDSSWNHQAVLEAMERIPELRYRFCGPCKEEGYLAKLRASPAWERVEYLGPIPQKEVPAFLASGSIGMAVLPRTIGSLKATGSLGVNKFFEEMAAGLPIICTDFTLWRDIVERWHCGICVEPDSVDEIAAAIQYLLDHPEEARRMGENGRRAVEEEFNWGAQEKKLLALYEEILK